MSRSFGRFCSASMIAACHFPGKSSKVPASSSAFVKLSMLKVVQLHERWVADDLPDAAA
jgi:hypothetical protein